MRGDYSKTVRDNTAPGCADIVPDGREYNSEAGLGGAWVSAEEWVNCPVCAAKGREVVCGAGNVPSAGDRNAPIFVSFLLCSSCGESSVHRSRDWRKGVTEARKTHIFWGFRG